MKKVIVCLCLCVGAFAQSIFDSEQGLQNFRGNAETLYQNYVFDQKTLDSQVGLPSPFVSLAGLPIYSVTEYGAIGDGVTDDYQAIVNTMNAARNAGIVFFPPGTYLVRQSLPLYDKVVLVGESKPFTTLKAGGDFPVIQELRTATNPLYAAGVMNLTIRGGGLNNENAHGIKFLFTNRVILSNLFLFSCRRGVDLGHSWQMFMIDVHAHGQGDDQNYIGFYLDRFTSTSDSNNAVQAVNCVAQYVSLYGFRILNGAGSKFVNCEAMNGERGFYIGDIPADSISQSVEFCHFVNCLADTNSVLNWHFARGSATSLGRMQLSNCWGGSATEQNNYKLENCEEMAFNGCLAISSGTNGFLLDTCDAIAVSGCVVKNWSRFAADNAGIQLNNSTNCAITGNTTSLTSSNGTNRGVQINGGSATLNIISGNVAVGGVGDFGAAGSISSIAAGGGALNTTPAAP